MRLILFLFTFGLWLVLYLFVEAKHWPWFSEIVFIQTILAWIYLMNAFVLVKRGETKELVLKFSQRSIKTLTPGLYWFPFLWWWGNIEGDTEIIPEKSFVHFDSRKIFRTRQLVGRAGLIEDISREFIIPFILRRNLWAIVICLILGFFLAKTSILIKEKYFDHVVLVKNNNIFRQGINNREASYQSKNYKESLGNVNTSTSQSNTSSNNSNLKNNQDGFSNKKEEYLKPREDENTDYGKTNDDDDDVNIYLSPSLTLPWQEVSKSDMEFQNQEEIKELNTEPRNFNSAFYKSELSTNEFNFLIYFPDNQSHMSSSDIYQMKVCLKYGGLMILLHSENGQYPLYFSNGSIKYFSSPSELYQYIVDNDLVMYIKTCWKQSIIDQK